MYVNADIIWIELISAWNTFCTDKTVNLHLHILYTDLAVTYVTFCSDQLLESTLEKQTFAN